MKKVPALSIGSLFLYLFFIVVFVASAICTGIFIKTQDYYFLVFSVLAFIYSALYMFYYFRIYVKLSPSKITVSRITYYDIKEIECKWWENITFRSKGKVQRVDNMSFDPKEIKEYGYNKDVGIRADKLTEADISYPYEVTFILNSGEKISWNIKPYSGGQIRKIVHYINNQASITPTGNLAKQYLN